ncbi:hypothetical protein PENTCL1PPCAC_25117 [Pristionchus entomophagus]|uniref:Uncharacterized protein n=1 Tax=Pristionchus entomophagus TaxID=358040 RepID=A0AAV5U8G3_9BILA|nr:hypothetical protein PENTCL1PPCAC_25117 [Pristionchus entomophagus]
MIRIIIISLIVCVHQVAGVPTPQTPQIVNSENIVSQKDVFFMVMMPGKETVTVDDQESLKAILRGKQIKAFYKAGLKMPSDATLNMLHSGYGYSDLQSLPTGNRKRSIGKNIESAIPLLSKNERASKKHMKVFGPFTRDQLTEAAARAAEHTTINV